MTRRALPPQLRTDVGVVIHVRPEGTTLRLVNLEQAWPAFLALLRVCQWEDTHSRDAIGARIEPYIESDGMAYTPDHLMPPPGDELNAKFIAALDEAEKRRLRPANPDDGEHLGDGELEAIKAAVTDEIRPILNSWLAEAKAAKRPSWSCNVKRHVRQFEATRAAIALATISDGDADVARAVIAAVIGEDDCQTHPIGALLAVLTIEEARGVARVCATIDAGRLLWIEAAPSGRLVVVGEVAAVLGRVA